VIWTRLLSLLIGGTVYTFSIILAVFLIGLGLGSGWGAALAKGKHPRMALGICQLLLVAAIAWSTFQLTQSLPYWPINPALTRSPWDALQLDLLRCAWAILPAALLWGASFPLALGAAAAGGDAGKLVGGIYAANTVGAIAGSLGFSIWLFALLGSQHAQQVLMAMALVAAVIVLLPQLVQDVRSSRSFALAPILALGIVGFALLAYSLPAIPGDLVAHGRYTARDWGSREVIEIAEGMNSSIAITKGSDNSVSFHVSGKVEASSLPQDMRLQRMLGHIPALVHPQPKSVLIVGCGAGVTSGSFCVHPDIERIVICELEPRIPPTIARHFGKENHDVVKDPRVELVYDDARHYMLTAKDKFDIITSDPIHPWVKGAASLYTREYFELCKARLHPGGVVTQWVPLYESSPAVVKSEFATFFEVFPESTVWSNDQFGQGYDTVALGQVEPTKIDVDLLELRMQEDAYAEVGQSLYEVGFTNVYQLLATYAGRAKDLEPWLKDAQINSDRNLRLQYLAGMGATQNQEESIFNEMLKHRTYPEQLFYTTPESRQALLIALGFAEFEP
jgi:spermidine synthase